jgi:DNA-binding response OmpR family regulator
MSHNNPKELIEMTSKILVADDSLTIQKVVGITLSSGDYELVQALDESQLMDHAKSGEFDLILLDFNLSESKSGYQLATELCHLAPHSKVMVMLGTFDSVDEDELDRSGIADKIVKPFEGQRFIQKCQTLIQQASEKTDDASFLADDLDDDNGLGGDWAIGGNQSVKSENAEIQEEEGSIFDTDEESVNPLADEIASWGMSVPGVIGKKDNVTLMPPVIEPSILPEEDDLSYPEHSEEKPSLSSQLISIDELSLGDAEDDDELEETNPSFAMPAPDSVEALLEKEINDDRESDDLWAVDEEIPSEETSDKPNDFILQMSDEEAEEKNDLEWIVPTESVERFEDRSSSPGEPFPAMGERHFELEASEIVDQVIARLRPELEKMVRAYCADVVEKVAWEIIPDLAENMIRHEIKEISNSVKDQ